MRGGVGGLPGLPEFMLTTELVAESGAEPRSAPWKKSERRGFFGVGAMQPVTPDIKTDSGSRLTAWGRECLSSGWSGIWKAICHLPRVAGTPAL